MEGPNKFVSTRLSKNLRVSKCPFCAAAAKGSTDLTVAENGKNDK